MGGWCGGAGGLGLGWVSSALGGGAMVGESG